MVGVKRVRIDRLEIYYVRDLGLLMRQWSVVLFHLRWFVVLVRLGARRRHRPGRPGERRGL